MGQIKRSGDPQRGDGAVDQLWNGRLPTIGDGAHIDHQGAGVEQVVILAHTGPAQLIFRTVGELKTTGGRLQPAYLVGVSETRLSGIGGHHIGTELNGQLGKHAVTGVRISAVDIHFTVRGGAGHRFAAHQGRAGTGKRACKEIGQLFYGGAQRNGFKDRAGHKGAGEKAVDVYPVVLGIALLDFGRVRRIKGGRGEKAEHLAGFIIVHAHGAFPTVQGLIGHIVEVRVDGKV